MTNFLQLTDELARQIRAAREASGQPQSVAAKRLKVSVRTLQAWEAGTAFPQIRHRERVAKFIERHAKEAA